MNQNSISSLLPSAYGQNVFFEEEEGDYVIVCDDVIGDGGGGDDSGEVGGSGGRFVDILDEDDDDGWDDVSYYGDGRDHDACDGGTSSPSLSCATSVATNITLRDLNHHVDDAGGIAAGIDAATSISSSQKAHSSRSSYDDDYNDYDDFGIGSRGAGCGGGKKKRTGKRGGGQKSVGVYSTKHVRLVEARRDKGRNSKGRRAKT
jgi:hypothetical protein